MDRYFKDDVNDYFTSTSDICTEKERLCLSLKDYCKRRVPYKEFARLRLSQIRTRKKENFVICQNMLIAQDFFDSKSFDILHILTFWRQNHIPHREKTEVKLHL